MARRILNRKDLRADFDAAERRKTDEDDDQEEDEEAEDGDEEEAEGEDEAGEEDEAEEGAGDGEDEEELPKKKKPAKAAKPPKPPKPVKAKTTRTRTPKVVRMKVIWGVFNNSNQRVAVYDYPKRKEADEHAAKLTADKKSTHFVQPVKEPLEEKKEA
jgi:cobalamin biosynthesis protein CobT